MKIVFISNYFNHHQSDFSEELFKLTNGDFYFVETESISPDRANMGFSIKKPEYIIRLSSNTADIITEYVNEADAVIVGGKTYGLVDNRLKNNKIVFVYSERIFKGFRPWLWVWLRAYRDLAYISKKNVVFLCASAFTSADFKKVIGNNNIFLKWGYFPPLVNEPYKSRNNKKMRILWVSRFLRWKHPEYPILLAKRLKEMDLDFELTLIGDGPLKQKYYNQIMKNNLNDKVFIKSNINNKAVRLEMEKADIFLLTSDKGEGWGAVLNEAMNSGCAILASSCAGSVPYLINDGVNGIIYQNLSFSDFFKKFLIIYNNEEFRKELGLNAVETIRNEWNGGIAARCLYEFITQYNRGSIDIRNRGILSVAEILNDKWYEIKK